MKLVLSPAKSLDYESPIPVKTYSQPQFLEEAEYLVKKLRGLSAGQLKKLMDISDDLAQTNVQRFAQWNIPFTEDNARQAIFAFKGDVYLGLDAYSMNQKDLEFAQNTVRILSGLYGLLKPLDLMQPYRLEMGTRLKVTAAKTDLYKFWGDEITKKLAHDMQEDGDDVLVNLASNEYFKAVKPKLLVKQIITPEFKDAKNGEYKMIQFFAKKARGLMTAYIIKNRITNINDLKGFDYEGYGFNSRLSSKDKWVFTREEKK